MSENELKIEEMGSFFDLRSESYEKHMEETINSFDEYYKLVSAPMEYTDEPVNILDLGCGTGLEIQGIFEKAPNAKITCIDLSQGMLDILKKKYIEHANQLEIINASYMEYDFHIGKYDYVFGIMTMHHFLYDEKLEIYKRIKASLKDGGKYIEGDYVVSKYYEKKWLKEREKLLIEHGEDVGKLYHIDIPFAVTTQKRLFRQAGFKNFNILFKEGEHLIYEVNK